MPDLERWDRELLASGQVRLRTKQSKNLWALLGCLGFTAVGVWAAADGAWLVAVLAVGFFGGLGIPAIGYQIVRPRDVHVTPADVRVDRVVLPWRQVIAVQVVTIMNQQTVVLRLTGEGARTVDGGLLSWVRRFQGANAKLLGGPVLALPTQLAGDKQQMGIWLALVHGRSSAPQDPGDQWAGDTVEPRGSEHGVGPEPAPEDHSRFMPPGTRPPRG
ncbi:hypothetical protein [Georgenia daeguensis]|uniref:DUF3093 family protein n=1 Tax=Georgenia daeguensis TaxID=908355 RepID=A0ABP8ERA5_9MICO